MEFFPTLSLGWLNGWIFLAIFLGFFGIFVKWCPKEVVARLYDEEGWTKFQKRATIAAKIFGVIHFILLIFTPIKFGTIEFFIGLILFIFGTVGMSIAIINFKNAPVNKPINIGCNAKQVNIPNIMNTGTRLTLSQLTLLLCIK